MNSQPWNCCRTCLSVDCLYPIYLQAEYHEKYSEVIFATTGIKVEMNDNLPQQMCSICINFINESVKFRRKCKESNEALLRRYNDKQYYTVKVENTTLCKEELEKQTSIDISHLVITSDDSFNDYDDNITLDSLQYQNSLRSIHNDVDTQSKNNEDVYNDKKVSKKLSNGDKVKRKMRISKKENLRVKKSKTEKGDRVKEEVECEYCHKILTSRLSLRNHYKIHTGFDVVCEHCGKKFITRRLLLMHCRAKHGYEKTDKCSYCDYRASNAEQVKIHERLHTGERPYGCSVCSARFHRKSSYLQHVAIHLPDKTVQCDQCPARFKSVTLMRIHKNRHKAATYSFQCRVCESSFVRRRNVARHLQRVHSLAPDEQHIERRRINSSHSI